MKVALVYDRVNKWGGAERVLLALHELFPQAPLYTAVYNPETAPWAKVFPRVFPSFLQKILGAVSRHELFPYLMPLAFESFSFDEYDLVISLTSEAAKGVITKPKTLHICYCLTPTRYLWSAYDIYFPTRVSRLSFAPVVSYLRFWDKIAAQRPDMMLAISKTVASRIKRYYNRDSDVIYPPVDVSKFKIQNSKFKITTQNSKFFLVVSRLVPYKRVDVAIEAFNRLKLPLVIIGTGSEEGRLRRLAGENITFLGELTDDELCFYYENAQALIFPQEEDFGLTAIEAQSLGCPVIAYKAGGATETVIEGKTGEFFYANLISVVKNFSRDKYKKKDLIENAKKFSKKSFIGEWKRLLKTTYTE